VTDITKSKISGDQEREFGQNENPVVGRGGYHRGKQTCREQFLGRSKTSKSNEGGGEVHLVPGAVRGESLEESGRK